MEGVTQPAVTQLVNRLERRGWVERHTDERDARAVLVALTAAGQAALDSARAEFARSCTRRWPRSGTTKSRRWRPQWTSSTG